MRYGFVVSLRNIEISLKHVAFCSEHDEQALLWE